MSVNYIPFHKHLGRLPAPIAVSTPQLEGLPDCTARILKRLSWRCELTVLVGPLLLVETHRL